MSDYYDDELVFEELEKDFGVQVIESSLCMSAHRPPFILVQDGSDAVYVERGTWNDITVLGNNASKSRGDLIKRMTNILFPEGEIYE